MYGEVCQILIALINIISIKYPILLMQDSGGSAELMILRHQPNENEARK